MRVVTVLGTRPQFIEMAPVIHQLQRLSDVDVLIYNTGQHYDQFMSEVFFDQLKIPEPDVLFSHPEGSEEPIQRMLSMIKQTADALVLHKPDMVVVEGDTDTALYVALAAGKLRIKVAHIEAGCRCYDKSLPEELNRVLITHTAEMHFAPTYRCKENLLAEAVSKYDIHMLGHPIVDSIELVKPRITEEEIDLGRHGAQLPKLEPMSYVYVTLHRDFNVDDPVRLERILKDLARLAEKRKLIFPIHPRTSKRIAQFGLAKYLNQLGNLAPVDYVTSLALTKYAYAVISDSGGLQKEAAILGTPMITMRPTTEWVETLGGYGNQLAFFDKSTSIATCMKALDDNYKAARESMAACSEFLGKPGVSSAIAERIRDPEANLLEE